MKHLNTISIQPDVRSTYEVANFNNEHFAPCIPRLPTFDEEIRFIFSRELERTIGNRSELDNRIETGLSGSPQYFRSGYIRGYL
jgi:hypothetical protein